MNPYLQETSQDTSPAAGDMPCGAAEHAAEQQETCHAAPRAYVRATVDSAWSIIIDGQSISSTWANAELISLFRIQQHIEMETHAPVTLEMLLHAEPRQAKQPRRSWWSNVESISRCVAGYHHAVGASEHDSIRSIQEDICGYAYTLRRGLPSNVDVTEFFALLHRAITNRALNMALRKTIDKSLGDDLLVGPDGRCVTQFGRQALADILEHCIDTVLTDYQSLQDNMRQFQPDR